MNYKTKSLLFALEIIAKIKKDCFNLKKIGDLTEYGKGQLDLISIIFRELELN